MKKAIIKLIKEILMTLLIVMFGCVGIIFSVLYIDTFNFYYFQAITAVSVSLISLLVVLAITFLRYKKIIVYKIFLLLVLAVSTITFSLYLLKLTGFLEKFDNIDKFRDYIQSFGSFAVIIFIIVQFLQVVALPVPSFITIGAGVVLFGAFWGAFYSCIGIIIGSIIAYLIGKIFGVKVAKWLVGEDNLNKGLKLISGKDRVVLTFMFLFPFFPDDLLCFVAGITTVSPYFFTVMILITRIISVFVSSYSLNNSIIPYNTWWGILLWGLFLILTIILTIIIYKYGESIERKILNRKNTSKLQ